MKRPCSSRSLGTFLAMPPQNAIPAGGTGRCARSSPIRPTGMRVALSAMFLFAVACHGTEIAVNADVPSAAGISVDSPVRFRGTDIGRVQGMTPTRGGARLDLLIARSAPVRAADRVAVRPDGLFGASFVDIVPGPDTARRIESRGTLAAVPADPSAHLREAVIQAVTKALLDTAISRMTPPKPAAARR